MPLRNTSGGVLQFGIASCWVLGLQGAESILALGLAQCSTQVRAEYC